MSGVLNHFRSGMAGGLALLFVLAGFALPALIRADYQAGLDAHQQGDFEKAYSEWIKVASSKDGEAHPGERAEAQYALGMLYWLGQGVPQDTSAAAVWLRQAAELDHGGAQSKLGYLYLSGQGVPQNDFEALKWLKMATYKNDADAQYNLGVMYRDGLGVEPDTEQSMYWFRQAAENGDPVSTRIVSGNPPADEKGRSPLAGDEDPQHLPGEALDEAWIRDRDPEHYTIQVIALLKLERLQTFMRQHAEWAPFAIYRQTYQGRPLYVLVQGDYPDVIQARAAAQEFPTDIQQRDKLWIRRFKMVQGLLQ
jgi:Sel1 repeat